MKPDELDGIPAKTWHALAARHAAWRTPVLANVTPDGKADARVVVLRAVHEQERELIFFTDRRSNKHAAIAVNPFVCLVVHDVDADWQVRLYGRAMEEVTERQLDAWWNALGQRQRALYAAGSRDGGARERGRENFAAFRVTIDRFHCLWLHDDGNEAAEFEWKNGAWAGTFVRP